MIVDIAASYLIRDPLEAELRQQPIEDHLCVVILNGLANASSSHLILDVHQKTKTRPPTHRLDESVVQGGN